MCEVSIVTPFYLGNKYLKKLSNNLDLAVSEVKDVSVEWIIVNDSPWESVDKTLLTRNIHIKIIENIKNIGIQKSRIEGIKVSKGEFLMLLDQDDEISSNSLKIHLTNLKNGADLSITNGYSELPDGSRVKLYHSRRQMSHLNKKEYYFYIGNLIASPGMTMIKKSVIPKIWEKNPLDINGADDWLLWVAMILEGRKIVFSDVCTYIHKLTGINTSNNNKSMLLSSKEALEIVEKNFNSSYILRLCKIYRRRLLMREQYELRNKNKIFMYLKNLDIAFYLIKFKKL